MPRQEKLICSNKRALVFLAGKTGILGAISQFYTLITPTFIISYAFTFSSLFIILLYTQIRKVADQLTSRYYLTRFDAGLKRFTTHTLWRALIHTG